MRRQDITARQRNSSRPDECHKFFEVAEAVRPGCVDDAVDAGNAARSVEPGVDDVLSVVTPVETGGDQNGRGVASLSGQSAENGASTLASVAHDALQ
jgi:hypothetical protein